MEMIGLLLLSVTAAVLEGVEAFVVLAADLLSLLDEVDTVEEVTSEIVFIMFSLSCGVVFCVRERIPDTGVNQ